VGFGFYGFRHLLFLFRDWVDLDDDLFRWLWLPFGSVFQKPERVWFLKPVRVWLLTCCVWWFLTASTIVARKSFLLAACSGS
jgi:hypothetical protein